MSDEDEDNENENGGNDEENVQARTRVPVSRVIPVSQIFSKSNSMIIVTQRSEQTSHLISD